MRWSILSPTQQSVVVLVVVLLILVTMVLYENRGTMAKEYKSMRKAIYTSRLVSRWGMLRKRFMRAPWKWASEVPPSELMRN